MGSYITIGRLQELQQGSIFAHGFGVQVLISSRLQKVSFDLPTALMH